MRRSKLTTPLPVLGIDISKPGEYVAAQATTNAQNVRVRRATIEKRPGTESAGDSLGERLIEMAELDTGSAYFFVRWGLTKFEEFNKATKAWTNRANAALTGTEADMISYAFPLLSGSRIMVYTNGLDAIRKYIGGSNDANLGGSPPLCKYLLFYANYLLLLNITTGGNRFPWRVQWCDLGDPETWVGGDAGSADLLEDSAGITGGGLLGQFATIHKENAIYIGQLTNSSAVIRFERRETGAGAVAHRSILSLPSGEQVFLARDGFRVFNGISAPLIESQVNDEIRDTLNPQYAYKAWAKLIKELDEVHIGVPIGSSTEPDTVYKFNYVTRQVFKDKRSNLTALGEYRNTEGQTAWDDLPGTWDEWVGPWDSIALADLNPVYVYGFNDGSVTQENTGSTDNGTAIESTWDSKDFTALDYGLPADTLMRWQGAQFWVKGSGSPEIFYSTDGGNTWTSAGTITLTDEYPADVSTQIAYFDKVAIRCRIRLSHKSNNQTFTMKQFTLVGVPREAVYVG